MQINAEYARFRWMFPISLLIAVLFISVGPYLFQHILDGAVQLILVYTGIRLAYMVVCSSISLYKALTVPVRQPNEFQTDVTYAWVIPSYNEDESVINTTLNQLATHSRAKNNYVVFLAMEEHEMGSKEKAEKIIRVQQEKFRHIGYTIHTLAAGEAKGKASNVSYCVENFQYTMPPTIELEKVYVTVVDCDSLAPKEYIDEVNARIYKNPERSLKTTFCPVQIFARNNLEVPLLVRAFDNFHSMAHWNSTFIPGLGFALPLSNYTISYVTLKSIGFWDKYAEAIGEDAHTFLKCFWKHNTDYYGETIYTPFNQLNLQSGAGYFDNCRHKFRQVSRHAQGLQDAGYNLNKFLQQKVKTLKSWLVAIFGLEALFFSPLIMPILGLAYYSQVLFMEPTPSRKAHYEFLHAGYEIYVTLFNVIVVVIHHCFVRYSAARYFGRKNIALWRVVEYYAFLLVGLWVIMFPSIVTSVIKGAIKHQEYVTAPKSSSSSDESLKQSDNITTTS